ncbi:hypothetical protein [Roseivirga sp.]|uniref:hypothetical protein n=1 Tax=Roseivirga sp. TaxID=1964215 RepID=UPI003B8D3955
MNKLILFLLFSGFLIPKLDAQDIDLNGLIYSNTLDDITELSFDENGRYVGIMKNRYLILFDSDNTIKDKLDLLKVNVGTGKNWFLVRKIRFSNDTISILNINSIQSFIAKNDTLVQIGSILRTTKIDELFEYKSSRRGVKASEKNNYLGKHNDWDFGYNNIAKGSGMIEPEIWLSKNGALKKKKLPRIKFDYKRSQLWKKDWAIIHGVFDNHFEIGKSNIYFIFPFHDNLIIFNTIDERFSEVTIPKKYDSQIWYTYIDPISAIPYLVVEEYEYFKIYYLNKKLEFIFLTESAVQPMGIINNQLYTINKLEEGKKKYSAHYLKKLHRD